MKNTIYKAMAGIIVATSLYSTLANASETNGINGNILAASLQSSSSLPMSSTTTSTPPKWSFLRQDEKWGNYYNNDFKHIKLNDSGSNWLSVGGHVRYRGENWRNLGFNDANDDHFNLGRATLHADFHFGKKLRVFTELKSANSSRRELPGGRRTLDVDTFDLQQAFVDYSVGKSRFRLGRQALSFGKQRLVSPLPWGNALRTWEGARYDYLGETWQTAAFATRFVPVKQYERNRSNKDQKFSGIYTQGKLGEWKTDFYAYNIADQHNRNTYTLGSYAVYKKPTWDFETEVAFQTGQDAADRDVSSQMLASELGVNIGNDMAKRVTVGFDYASGDDDPLDNKNQTFDQLFPLGHAYLGFADHIGRRNVVAANAAAIMKLSDKITSRLAIHTFYKAEKADAIYNAGGAPLRPAPGNENGSRHIGNEIDLTFTYAHNRHLKVDAGIVYLKSGDAIEETSNSANVRFAFVGVNFMF